jgi:quercetin dioxygenase-like cupin family protein
MTQTEQQEILPAEESLDGIVWEILGQTYRPKQRTEESMAWHATLPPGTFVPPHVHPTQHEYLYVLEGTLDFWLDGETKTAKVGDLAKLAMGIPHGIYNNSQETAKALLWVAPTGKLWDLFEGIHRLDPQTGEAVAALAAEHEVEFLPPPEGSA